MNAMNAANAANSRNSTDRQVIVPKGVKLSIMPVSFENMTNVRLTVDGTIYVSEHYKDFPQNDVVIQFNNSDSIHIDGNGTIDGRGFMWWVRDIF